MAIKMSSARNFFLPFVLVATVVHCVHAVSNRVGNNFLFNKCVEGKNYTLNSPYQANLQKLKSHLAQTTPKSGFSSYRVGNDANAVTGLALCRADVSPEHCKKCVSNATTELCNRTKTAIVWYDHCLLKYSDENFLGKVDVKNRVALINVKDITEHLVDNFTLTVTTMLQNLAQKAVNSKMLYANEKTTWDSRGLYGFLQCTGDLDKQRCKKCFDKILSRFPCCCMDGPIGGRILTGSCNFRYERYNFLKFGA